MPSSNKTGVLGLNKWLGTDKPKKDDFNGDNTILDTAFSGLQNRVQSLESGTGNAEQTAGQALDAANAHAADGSIHVTAAEKAVWNNPPQGGDSMIIGTYSGTGIASLKVATGFKPKLGILYGVGKGSTQADWSGQETRVYCGFFGTNGCSKNIAVNSDGFTVTHNVTTPMDGCAYKYNESGVTYVYAVWPE